MAEGNPLMAIERGEKVTMPPALWIQPKGDLIHDYRDPNSGFDGSEAQRFTALYRRAGGDIELEYYDAALHFTQEHPDRAARDCGASRAPTPSSTSTSRRDRFRAMLRHAVIASLLVLVALASRAPAQTVAEFYKGKQIRFVVGTSTGQDYDLWARLIGRHITRHIPGQPTLIVENMPGAGHIIATNHLYTVAAKDGTVIGMVSRNMTDAAIMKLPNVRYDPGKFNWLGSPEINHRVMFVSASSDIRSVPDLFARELVVGTPGGAQGVTAAPLLLKHLLGMKLKIVQGYRSPGDVVLAMARGEVGGFVNSVGGPEGARRQWVATGQMRVLFNMEPQAVAWLDAPTVFDFVKTDEQRQVLTFFAGNTQLGRPLMAPPDVPAERVEALRRAFDATMKEPGLPEGGGDHGIRGDAADRREDRGAGRGRARDARGHRQARRARRAGRVECISCLGTDPPASCPALCRASTSSCQPARRGWPGRARP